MRGKDYLRPRQDEVPHFAGEVQIVTFEGNETVYKKALDQKIEIIVSLNPKSNYVDSGAKGIQFVILQYSVDTFVRSTLDELVSSDRIILYTPFWLDWAVRYFEMRLGIPANYVRARLTPKVRFAGFPQMDSFSDLNSMELRKKFNIPEGKRVVLLLPITLANKSGAWPRFFEATNRFSQLVWLIRGTRTEGWDFAKRLWRWAFFGWNDLALSRAINQFAQSNNAVLVVKGREKDPIRPWLRDMADVVIYDEKMHPATTMELLAISDLCIQFYSFAVLEAAYCGVPSLTIDRPSPAAGFLETPPLHYLLWVRNDEGSAFNYPGVVRWTTIPETISQLPGAALDEFALDSDSQQKYVDEFLFSGNQKASEVIISLLSEL